MRLSIMFVLATMLATVSSVSLACDEGSPDDGDDSTVKVEHIGLSAGFCGKDAPDDDGDDGDVSQDSRASGFCGKDAPDDDDGESTESQW